MWSTCSRTPWSLPTGHLPPAWGEHQRGPHPPTQLRTDPCANPGAGSNITLLEMWLNPCLNLQPHCFRQWALFSKFWPFGGGTLCAPYLGELVVAGWGFAAPGGIRGIRRGWRKQGPQQGSAQRSPKKERGLKQGKAGEKSWRVRAGSESQGQN